MNEKLYELKDAVWEYLDDLSKGGYNKNTHRSKLCKLVGFNINKLP